MYKANDITYANEQTSNVVESDDLKYIMNQLKGIQMTISGLFHDSKNAPNQPAERPYRSDPRNAPVAPVSSVIYEKFLKEQTLKNAKAREEDQLAEDYAEYRARNPIDKIEKPKQTGLFSRLPWGKSDKPPTSTGGYTHDIMWPKPGAKGKYAKQFKSKPRKVHTIDGEACVKVKILGVFKFINVETLKTVVA